MIRTEQYGTGMGERGSGERERECRLLVLSKTKSPLIRYLREQIEIRMSYLRVRVVVRYDATSMLLFYHGTLRYSCREVHVLVVHRGAKVRSIH